MINIVFMEKYLSIEQTVEYTKKSISSIRRLVKELKQSKSKHIKLEKLKTGHDKVFISIEYLDEHFNINNSTNSSTSSSTNNSNESFVNKTLDLLSKELEEKNRQIESLLQRQYESNVIIEQLQKKQLQLEENTTIKKKWWQRK
jgi:hypothetical protein